MATKIIVYSHGIMVIPESDRVKRILFEYCTALAEWRFTKKPPEWKVKKEMTRVFAAATKDRREFRFHRNQLEPLLLRLSAGGVHSSGYEIEYHTPVDGEAVEFDTTELPPAYDYQEPIIEHLSSDKPIKVTNAQTGKGKTLMAIHAIAKLKRRTVLQLRGGYIVRWTPDLKKFLGLNPGEDLLVVRGTKHMLALIEAAKLGTLTAKVIIISSKTMQQYISDYEKHGDNSAYGVRPENFYETINAGLKIIDEVHEDFHLNYKSDIYSNVKSGIYLSATLETADSFRQRMYDVALPADCWMSTVYDAYVEVRAKMYCNVTAGDKRIKTKQPGRDDYSHSAYEDSILAHADLTKNYLKIILESFLHEFTQDTPFEHGQKCLIFCSLQTMCDTVTKYLSEQLGDFTVNSFYSGVSTDVIEQSDIIVSTVESMGTAADVPGLKVVCLTRAIDKLEKNEQIKGRLRKMKAPWKHITPIMVYLVNQNIDKHVQYHENKVKNWAKKVTKHRTFWLENKL